MLETVEVTDHDNIKLMWLDLKSKLTYIKNVLYLQELKWKRNAWTKTFITTRIYYYSWVFL